MTKFFAILSLCMIGCSAHVESDQEPATCEEVYAACDVSRACESFDACYESQGDTREGLDACIDSNPEGAYEFLELWQACVDSSVKEIPLAIP